MLIHKLYSPTASQLYNKPYFHDHLSSKQNKFQALIHLAVS